MIYVIIKTYQLNKNLELVLGKENLELKSLGNITKEEKEEARLLRVIRAELGKLLYGEKVKGGIKKEEMEKAAERFWKMILKLSKSQYPSLNIKYSPTKVKPEAKVTTPAAKIKYGRPVGRPRKF